MLQYPVGVSYAFTESSYGFEKYAIVTRYLAFVAKFDFTPDIELIFDHFVRYTQTKSLDC